MVRIAIEKDTVFGGLFFNEAVAEADAAEVFLFDLVRRHFQEIRQGIYFGTADPDISFLGSGATVAALEAVEGQAVAVPAGVF